MIRLLVSLGRWLDGHFPEKRVVLLEDYIRLHGHIESAHQELIDLTDRMHNIELLVEKMAARISYVEASSIHKDAMKDVISVVSKAQEEMNALKFGLGMTRSQNSPEMTVLLNGEPIGVPNE